MELVAVPAEVAWFWEQPLVEGNVPFVYREPDGRIALGTFEPDEHDTPFLLCLDDDVRVRFAALVIRAARAL